MDSKEKEKCMCGMDKDNCRCRKWGGGAGAGAVYGLGLLGALVFYIQNADTFWVGVLGILKAIVWPAFLVYELLKSLIL